MLDVVPRAQFLCGVLDCYGDILMEKISWEVTFSNLNFMSFHENENDRFIFLAILFFYTESLLR